MSICTDNDYFINQLKTNLHRSYGKPVLLDGWDLPEEEWGVPERSPQIDWDLIKDEWDGPETKLVLPESSMESDLDYIEDE